MAINIEEPKNIVVRMPNWLGDLVMATPVLLDLRKKWPNARITAMCQSNVAPLLKHAPEINEVFAFKRVTGWIHHMSHSEVIQALDRAQFDLGILLTNSFSSAWWFWRGDVKNRIGFTNGFRNLLLNESVPLPKNIEKQHLVLTYKELLVPLGINISNTAPTLFISNEEKREADVLLQQCGVDKAKHTLVGINPGAAYGSAKCWLPERFHEVTLRLLENPNTFVAYFGDPAGTSLVNDICKNLPDRVINLAGKTTLRELLPLIQKCDAFLTNDSGPMHIAAALNVPLVAIFGSTSDVKTGPYGIGKVIHKHVECSPCYKRVCPIDFRCMKRITVEEVYQSLNDIIQKKK